MRPCGFAGALELAACPLGVVDYPLLVSDLLASSEDDVPTAPRRGPDVSAPICAWAFGAPSARAGRLMAAGFLSRSC